MKMTSVFQMFLLLIVQLNGLSYTLNITDNENSSHIVFTSFQENMSTFNCTVNCQQNKINTLLERNYTKDDETDQSHAKVLIENLTENMENKFPENGNIPLYIGGLFELSGDRGMPYGHSELTAAKLAIQHVNLNEVLPGYELNLLKNDTKVCFNSLF